MSDSEEEQLTVPSTEGRSDETAEESDGDVVCLDPPMPTENVKFRGKLKEEPIVIDSPTNSPAKKRIKEEKVVVKVNRRTTVK